jgi:hypothetical protein
MFGIYAGIQYFVMEKDGKRYIALKDVTLFIQKGANMRLLDDIGKQDPDEVMAALFESMKKDSEN